MLEQLIKMQVKYRNFVFAGYFFSLKFVGIVFISSLYDLASDSKISSHIITESP